VAHGTLPGAPSSGTPSLSSSLSQRSPCPSRSVSSCVALIVSGQLSSHLAVTLLAHSPVDAGGWSGTPSPSSSSSHASPSVSQKGEFKSVLRWSGLEPSGQLSRQPFFSALPHVCAPAGSPSSGIPSSSSSRSHGFPSPSLSVSVWSSEKSSGQLSTLSLIVSP